MDDDIVPQIVDIGAIESIISTIQQDGKDVVMSEDASKRIADFKKAQKLLAEAEDILKQHIRVALTPFNARSVRGRYATISINKPRQPAAKYSIDKEYLEDLDEFRKDKIVRIPDEEKIAKYEKKHGDLPHGIYENLPGEGSMSIRLKG